jgi:hypothetical protein
MQVSVAYALHMVQLSPLEPLRSASCGLHSLGTPRDKQGNWGRSRFFRPLRAPQTIYLIPDSDDPIIMGDATRQVHRPGGFSFMVRQFSLLIQHFGIVADTRAKHGSFITTHIFLHHQSYRVVVDARDDFAGRKARTTG